MSDNQFWTDLAFGKEREALVCRALGLSPDESRNHDALLDYTHVEIKSERRRLAIPSEKPSNSSTQFAAIEWWSHVPSKVPGGVHRAYKDGVEHYVHTWGCGTLLHFQTDKLYRWLLDNRSRYRKFRPKEGGGPFGGQQTMGYLIPFEDLHPIALRCELMNPDGTLFEL